MNDLTIIYYTANVIPEKFAQKTRARLIESANGYPIISVSHKPIDLGKNIVVDLNRSHFNIYRQALIGAKSADTQYIALAEDDILYSPDHFKYRPLEGIFAYDLSVWSIYTWVKPPLFSYKDRRNLSMLVCEKDIFIEAMEERFAKYITDHELERKKHIWAEPGKYERQLGVMVRSSEEFYSTIPNIAFSHETALSYDGLGQRKKIGHMRSYDIPFWGKASDIIKLYE